MDFPKERQHVVACYRALGCCGSSLSVPFLRQQLLGRPLSFGVRRTLKRQCAALALGLLDQDGARSALAKAAKSICLPIRRAARRARELEEAQP